MTSQDVVRLLLSAKGGHTPTELAHLIDIIYEVEPVPGSWVSAALPVAWLQQHIVVPVDQAATVSAHGYARMRTIPPPIILVGAAGSPPGLALLDGRRRLLAAAISKAATIPAILPSEHLCLTDTRVAART